MAEAEEGPIGHILSTGRGTALSAAIEPLCRGGIGVQGDQSVGAQTRCG